VRKGRRLTSSGGVLEGLRLLLESAYCEEGLTLQLLCSLAYQIEGLYGLLILLLVHLGRGTQKKYSPNRAEDAQKGLLLSGEHNDSTVRLSFRSMTCLLLLKKQGMAS